MHVRSRYAIAIHGGAGTINNTDEHKLREAKAALEACLRAGEEVLAAGGSALDAVEAAVVALENDPHFNAGVCTLRSYTSLARPLESGNTWLQLQMVAGNSLVRLCFAHQ